MYHQLTLCLALDAIALVIFRLIRGRRWERKALAALTLAWAFATVYLTLFRGKRGSGVRGFKSSWPLPFWEVVSAHHYGLTTNRSVLNMLLFVPLGYLVPRLQVLSQPNEALSVATSKVGILQTVICGLAASLAIEAAQYVLGRGVFELDDLVKNMLGTALGWGAFYLINLV